MKNLAFLNPLVFLLNKMIGLFVFPFALIPFMAHGDGASNMSNISRLLVDIKNKSLQIETHEHQKASEILLNESQYMIFDIKSYLGANYSIEESPQMSPFGTSDSKSYEYNFRVTKQRVSGLKYDLSYTLRDRSNKFFSGMSNDFLAPQLQMGFSTNLFQDVFGQRYRYLQSRVSGQSGVLSLEKKVQQKGVLAQGLVDFSSLLVFEDEVKLQGDLCKQIGLQSQKLSKKRRRKSVSKRDYYLSLREVELCAKTIEEIKKTLIEKKKNLEATYNIEYGSYGDIDTKSLFKDLQKSYSEFENQAPPNLLGSKDELRLMVLKLKTYQSQQRELDALAKTPLRLEFATGATGLSDSLSVSHRDVGHLKYPYISLGLKLDWPWVDSTAKAQARANQYKMRALEAEKNLMEDQISKRLETLKVTVKKDFSIYDKHLKMVRLSKLILKEANYDFNNGRMDFFTLTEFNKRLIQDQKNLSSHRVKLLVRVIEYLDYYNYFDLYL